MHNRSYRMGALFLAAGIGAAWPSPNARDRWGKPGPRTAYPSATARYLPPSFEADPAAIGAFRTLMARMRMDSTRHWEFARGRLRISYDLMQELAGGSLFPGGGRMAEKLSSLLGSRGIAVDPGGTAHASYLPDDAGVASGQQWQVRNTGAALGGRPGQAGLDLGIERVWDKFSGSDSLVIAVLDAGFDFEHPDLKGKHWVNPAESAGRPGVDDDANGYVDDSIGWDFVSDDNNPQDRHGHGTMTSSAIVAGFDNGIGIAGIIPKARIMPVRVLDASGHGDLTGIAKGIQYAVRNGAKAVNYSIGSGMDSRTMRTAFQAAQAAGVPIIVAAGNSHVDLNANPAYPVGYTYDNIITVAAHDHAGLLCDFSNYGRTVVHLAAPGEFIPACDIAKPIYSWWSYFESDTLEWDTTGAWRFTNINPLEQKQSIEWVAGDTATLTSHDTLDLLGIDGGVLLFRVNYRGADTSDALIVEANRIGTSTWTTLAAMWGMVDSTAMQSIGLQDVDGSRFRLRFRAVNNPKASAAKRVLKIDELLLRIPNPNPNPGEMLYPVSGTSIAAPFVTAYVGLLRLACDRMGVAYSRARAFSGVDTVAALAGKVSTGGRLDIYKGLRFYLETLPGLQVSDSNMLAWKAGEKLEYALSVAPAGPDPYAFSVLGLPKGLGIDGAGKLTWIPTDAQAGEYTARFFAEGPTTLRKLLQFRIDPADGTTILVAGWRGDGEWILGGRRFRFPPGLGRGRRFIEITASDAAGRVRVISKGWMDDPASAPAPRGFPAPAASFHGWRVRVDGMTLASER